MSQKGMYMKKFKLIQLSFLIIAPTLLATNSVFASNDDYDGGQKPCCITSPTGVTTVNQNGPYASPVQGTCPNCQAKGGNYPNNQPFIKEPPPVPPSKAGGSGTQITPKPSGGRPIGGNGGGRPGGGGGKFNNRQ
jgi:hypothetical protein